MTEQRTTDRLRDAMREPCCMSDAHGQACTCRHEIYTHTFAAQHNPNCPSPWLVRLPGKSAFIDLKPYSSFTAKDDLTGDILGFGATFLEAADAALAQDINPHSGQRRT